MKWIILPLLMLVVGCAPRIQTVYQRVDIPVPVHRTAPDWLSKPYSPEALPEFLPPGRGVVALDQDGVNNLKIILRTLSARDEAWRVWSTNDQTN